MNRLSCSFFLIAISLLALNSSAQPNQRKILVPPAKNYYFKTNELWPYAILKFDVKRNSHLFGADAKPSTLSVSGIGDIENLIKKRITVYNKSGGQFIGHPEKYYKQFIAVINSKGEKEVWVNCFCKVTGDGWKKNIEWVMDGG